jgi:hypothetical protein
MTSVAKFLLKLFVHRTNCHTDISSVHCSCILLEVAAGNTVLIQMSNEAVEN